VGDDARRYLAGTTDTTVKAVTFEDGAALVGLVLAALGLFLEQVTGSATWDGLAALAIGVLLLGVAGSPARADVALLIGQSLPRRLEDELRAEVAGLPQVVDSRSCSPR
jgi:divalent metal cation (Fe/Co/Zn/Cd) transporter